MALRVVTGVASQVGRSVGSADWQANVQDITALEALTSGGYADKQIRLVEDKGNHYRFDAESTTATDGDTVVRPDDIASDATAGRWHKIVGLGGDVVGPASAADNAIARYSGTGGKTVQNSTVYVDDSGNLGVGTASPAAQAHLYKAAVSQSPIPLEMLRLEIEDTGVDMSAGHGPGITFFVGETSGSDWGGTVAVVREAESDADSASAMVFHTAIDDTYPAERMRISSAGNVGIGTTSPAYTLDVVGDVTATSGSFTATKHDDADGARAKVVIRKSKGTAGSPTVITDGDALGAVDFEGYDGDSWATGACIEAIVSGTPGNGDIPTKLTFSTAADESESPTTRLTIGADGAAVFTGNVTVGGNLILDDGGSILEAGGTAAITISATGEVTKIGLDTHGDGQVLTWDNGNSKVVWADAAGGGGAFGTTVQNKTANYTAASGDGVILCDSTGGAFTITLPSSGLTSGAQLVVKDKGGDASTYGVTVATEGSETIDGSVSDAVIAQDYGSISFVWDGSNYWIM